MLICAALLAVSLAATPPDDTAALRALELRWAQASVHRNIRALSEILAEGYVDTDYKGQLRTRVEVLAAPAAPSPASARLSGLAVHLFGDTAVVTGINTVSGVTPQHQRYRVEVHFTDVFQRQHGRWRAIASQEMVRSP